MLPTSSPLGSLFSRYRLASLLLALLLASAALLPLGGTASAYTPSSVTYANNHVYWTYYNHTAHRACTGVDQYGNYTGCYSTTDAKGGQFQPDFQCAEFVARALATEGLMPGLSASTSSQSKFEYYKPGNGKTYDLLLVTPLTGYHTLQAYLTDYGYFMQGDLARAIPGDLVLFRNSSGTPEHIALITSVGSDAAHTYVDAHNAAHKQVTLAWLAKGFASYTIYI